jgi:hypothetical protein
MTIEADDDLVTDELAAEANSPQHRNRHRVTVRRPLESDPVSIAAFSGNSNTSVSGTLSGVSVFQLSALADQVLAPKLRGLAGGNRFTNLKPIEQDANAASAIFLRKRWREEVTPLLDDPEHGPLARSLTPPGSTETLVTAWSRSSFSTRTSVELSRRRGPSVSGRSSTSSHPAPAPSGGGFNLA